MQLLVFCETTVFGIIFGSLMYSEHIGNAHMNE